MSDITSGRGVAYTGFYSDDDTDFTLYLKGDDVVLRRQWKQGDDTEVEDIEMSVTDLKCMSKAIHWLLKVTNNDKSLERPESDVI